MKSEISFVETSREMSIVANLPFSSEYISEKIWPPSSVSYHGSTGVFEAAAVGADVDPPLGVPAVVGRDLSRGIGVDLSEDLDVRPTEDVFMLLVVSIAYITKNMIIFRG
jgi:hypothetical protein